MSFKGIRPVLWVLKIYEILMNCGDLQLIVLFLNPVMLQWISLTEITGDMSSYDQCGVFFPFVSRIASKKQLVGHFSCLPLHSSARSHVDFNQGFRLESFFSCVLYFHLTSPRLWSSRIHRNCSRSIYISSSSGKFPSREVVWARHKAAHKSRLPRCSLTPKEIFVSLSHHR